MTPPEGVPVRDASTVVLLRDGTSGLEVWLLTRVTQMVFAGGMAVFPGGRVDDDDADLPFLPGAEEDAARRFACPAAPARALLGAAVREVFEETGVLLTVPAVEPGDLVEARTEVEAGRVAFGDLLRGLGVRVDAAAVRPWSRWVTPEGEVRRYDTRFFVATLPRGVEATDVTTESSAARWFAVTEALELAQRGVLALLPPTLMTLASLTAFGSAADVIAASAARDVLPVEPAVSRTEDGGYVATLPDGTALPLPRSLFP